MVDAPLSEGASADGLGWLKGLSRISITRDARGVGEELVALLGQFGFSAQLVDAGQAISDSDGLIVLDGLEGGIASNRRAFLAAKQIARKLSEGPGLFVTVQDTGGSFGLQGSASCWSAGLSGLAKTARLEWPLARIKAIDLDCGDRGARELAQGVLRELREGGSEAEVGLHRDGRRIALRLEDKGPAGMARERASVDSSSVILATGGARGVTARCLLELVREFKPRALIVCGRTPLADEPEFCRGIQDGSALKHAFISAACGTGEALSPRALNARVESVLRAREVRSNLDAFKEAGTHVEYLSVDICDAQAIKAVLEPLCRRLGPVTGIVHGAGVLADKRIADKTIEQFNSVFDTKAVALEQLLQATADMPLELLCLFSSVAARSGNLGQSDYAMANEVLNKVASHESRRRLGACMVKSMNWGPWEGGMVTPELSRHFQGLGVSLIGLQDGARAFVEEIRSGDPEVEVVFGHVELARAQETLQ